MKTSDGISPSMIQSINHEFRELEEGIENRRDKVDKLHAQRQLLEENISLLEEKLGAVTNEKESLYERRERVRETIAQIETFRQKVGKTLETMVTTVQRGKTNYPR